MTENSVRKGQLIVLSGPSGSGKSTVIQQLMEQRSNIMFSVSYTTRQPRVGEVDGVSYNFVDRATFEKMIEAGEFLEYAQYASNYYGTSLKFIEEKRQAGYDVLLDIEVEGASNVRAKCPEAVLVFFIPPTYEELESRLRGRKTDPEDVIRARLARALEEIKEVDKYDYLVVNDRVEDAADELDAIITAAGRRVENCGQVLARFV